MAKITFYKKHKKFFDACMFLFLCACMFGLASCRMLWFMYGYGGSSGTRGGSSSSEESDGGMAGNLSIKGADYIYVKSTGNDSADGKSEDSPVATMEKAFALATSVVSSKTAAVIYVLDEITLSSALTCSGTSGKPFAGKTLGISGGGIIRRTSAVASKPLISVDGTATLTLQNIKIDGNKVGGINAKAPLIQVDGRNGAVLNLLSNAYIQNNRRSTSTSSDKGSGIAATGQNSVININGGYVAYNEIVNGSGKGVGIYTDGKLNMKSGVIAGNYTAKARGGAVYLDAPAVFTMTGGTVSDNQALSANSVYVASGANFLHDGIEIDGIIFNAK